MEHVGLIVADTVDGTVAYWDGTDGDFHRIVSGDVRRSNRIALAHGARWDRQWRDATGWTSVPRTTAVPLRDVLRDAVSPGLDVRRLLDVVRLVVLCVGLRTQIGRLDVITG